MPDNTSSTLFDLRRVTLAPERLDDVTVEIRSGVTAILGASGAGKTSLLNILAAFEEPANGTIERPAKLYWAPQDGGLWPGMTVREHLTAMTRDTATIDATLEAFELSDCVKQIPSTLSRGQQARLTVARALVADALALIMDEPLAHIDTNRRSPFWDIIRDSITSRGQSLVFATHEPELVLGEAEHVICISAGRVVFSGIATDLYWNPASPELATFLGPANWISETVKATWLATEDIHIPRCLRPEQLLITVTTESNASPIIVSRARFRGSHEEVTLHHTMRNERSTFWHRPRTAALKEGDSVVLAMR